MKQSIAIAVVLAVAAGLSTGACAHGSPAPVSLAGTWPSEPDAYDDVTDRWTRRDRVRGNMEDHLSEIVHVQATLLSPEWRAAYIVKRSEDERMSPARRQALLAEHRERNEAYYEVMLLVRAHERRLVDLDRDDRSVWTVVISDGRGHEVEAEEIELDRRLDSVISEYFPNLGDFDKPFIARFPRDIELFGAGAEAIELVLSSPRATVTLVWEDAS